MISHAAKLQRVFDRLRSANFKIQLEKCQFAVSQVEYLGHIVISEGVRPDPSKSAAIANYPRPRTVREVRAFIGLASYYRRHVPNFAEKYQAITKLTSNLAVLMLFIWA